MALMFDFIFGEINESDDLMCESNSGILDYLIVCL